MPLETDPIDLLLDDDGDLIVTTDLAFSAGVQAVVQMVRVSLLSFRDEWFADLDDGVPYYQDILGHKYDRIRVRNAMRDAILDRTGVVELLSLDVELDTPSRVLTVTWEGRTEFGDTAADTLEMET